MLHFNNDDLYNRGCYVKVYIPEIIGVKISELEMYSYVKTIRVGAKNGHIIQGKNEYILCLSSDDTVKIDKEIYLPLGFTRKTVQELEALGKMFHDAYMNDGQIRRSRLEKVVEPPSLDINTPWNIKTKGHKLINTKTGEEVNLGGVKHKICKQIGLTPVHIDTLLAGGYVIKDWAYKGNRLDGKTWEEALTPFSFSSGVALKTP